MKENSDLHNSKNTELKWSAMGTIHITKLPSSHGNDTCITATEKKEAAASSWKASFQESLIDSARLVWPMLHLPVSFRSTIQQHAFGLLETRGHRSKHGLHKFVMPNLSNKQAKYCNVRVALKWSSCQGVSLKKEPDWKASALVLTWQWPAIGWHALLMASKIVGNGSSWWDVVEWM